MYVRFSSRGLAKVSTEKHARILKGRRSAERTVHTPEKNKQNNKIAIRKGPEAIENNRRRRKNSRLIKKAKIERGKGECAAFIKLTSK